MRIYPRHVESRRQLRQCDTEDKSKQEVLIFADAVRANGLSHALTRMMRHHCLTSHQNIEKHVWFTTAKEFLCLKNQIGLNELAIH